ncbi:MAG: Virulence protein RhuM family protein [Candidatus Argoarchaeum ethanivorans]|uniref:Virulence protein RhuM family protein n=1 Tax=Candidatus Argoarchaeum ethanivorans TaxID=2608793 RepID=A0A811TE42_9EURY|nr:MAG: Virulence protein RhuM family protein [Candidatus Argoarchaeum ethanivorans]
MNKSDIVKQQSDFILYTSGDGDVNVEVFLKDETVWLTQKGISGLFGVNVPAISKHLANIYKTGELRKKSTISILETVQNEGGRNVRRKMEFYNLDAIISVGYRVNSYQATQFRIWATRTLKEYIIKGVVMDDERLKQGNQLFGKDYFEELLERIREIRASERRFYQKITDIYALAADYYKNAPATKDFFATVQNKLYWAITGKTWLFNFFRVDVSMTKKINHGGHGGHRELLFFSVSSVLSVVFPKPNFRI